ncbi:MAG: hypothetical protein IPI50_05055 [Saprospiraceae bacterium]|nr:hypothetical protein [Saprospiraceae bacterium]
MKSTGVFFLWVLILFGCGNEQSSRIEEMTQIKLEERKSKFINERMLDCYRKTIGKAQSISDSILRIESKIQKFDSIPVPYDTFKPSKPEIIFPPFIKPKRIDEDTIIKKL